MNQFQKLIVAGFFIAVLSAAGKNAYAGGDCTPVYGGGVVCPTATPAPTGVQVPTKLPQAGVEEYVLPGLVTLLSGGLFLINKARNFGQPK